MVFVDRTILKLATVATSAKLKQQGVAASCDGHMNF